MDNKKSLVALALVALVGIVGGTFAYFTSSAKLTNEFTTGTYATSVTEEFVSPDNWTPGTTTQKKVNVTNNGSVEVAVRATYTETWTAADGTVLSGTRNGERVAQFAIGSDWELASDGKYYYKETLGTGETSTNFISSVTFNPNFILEEGTDIECTTTKENGKTTVECANLTSGYAGATYTLEITIETIQADQKWTCTSAYAVGTEVTIAGEKFNIISSTDDTVTMLAQFNLDSTYKQNKTQQYVYFSNYNGWSGQVNLDIQMYDGPAKTYVNNYVSYLQIETGDYSVSGNLITLGEVENLGCSLIEEWPYSATCQSPDIIDWLFNDQSWWTRTSFGDSGGYGIVIMNIEGWVGEDYDYPQCGIRPVITISKSTLEKL